MAESNRHDLAVESRWLVRRSTWCGIVFSLVVLITVLNFFPAINVQYVVRSKVVVSESRFSQLRELVKKDRLEVTSGNPKGMRLLEVVVLDRSRSALASHTRAKDEQLILVEVHSRWSQRPSEKSHAAWLEANTKVPASRLANSKLAQQGRIARWELQAAQHYAARHRFLRGKEEEPSITSDGRIFELPRMVRDPKSHSGVPASLVSQRTVSPATESSGEATDGPTAQLERRIELARQRTAETELAWQREIEQSSGMLQVAGRPEVSTRTSLIPLWMATSVLILGLASGSTIGWIQHRLQSGGAYESKSVAHQLTFEGIPVVGRFELPVAETEQPDWIEIASRQAGSASRRVASQLTRLSEWALGFWCVLIVGRLALDPMWRSVLIESPLAALGRLVVGMP